jgi:hypothetical protein
VFSSPLKQSLPNAHKSAPIALMVERSEQTQMKILFKFKTLSERLGVQVPLGAMIFFLDGDVSDLWLSLLKILKMKENFKDL